MARMENMSDFSPRGYKWTLVALLWVTVQQLNWQGEHIHTRWALQPLSKETKCTVDFIRCKQHAGFGHSDVQSFLYNGNQECIKMTVAWNSFSYTLFLVAVGIIDGDLFLVYCWIYWADWLFSLWRGLADISCDYLSKPVLYYRRIIKTVLEGFFFFLFLFLKIVTVLHFS